MAEDKPNKDSKTSTSPKPGVLTYSTGAKSRLAMPGWAKQRRPNVSKKLSAAVLLVVLCFGAGFGGGFLGSRYGGNSSLSNASTSVKQQYISSEGQLIADIAKNVGASVVSINTTAESTTQDFFGFNTPISQQSAGTGFIITSDGIIITNRHVVPEGTTNVSVTMADGTRFRDVEVIGRTSSSSPIDIAFLKIKDLNGKKLTPVTLGDSSKVQVGDKVVAIGNALGQFQNTVTSGIISGYGRDVTASDQTGASSENLTDLFQTDAAINEGNSGGPLVNLSGQVIGVNTAVAGNAQNIGFSIPINDVKGLINSVLSKGRLEQAFLGVRYVSLTPDIAYQYNLSVDHGAYVVPTTGGQSSVVPGSPAAAAGLKEKDIITKVNDIKIDEKTNLTGALSHFQPGDKVSLTIVRAGKTIHVNVTLGRAPQA